MKNSTISTAIKNALPALSELINKELGFTPELQVEIKVPYQSFLPTQFIITSGDLMNELGDTLSKAIFANIKIRCWGGGLAEDGIHVCYQPHLEYIHPNGGNNSTQFIWDGLFFNLENNEWITKKNK